MFKRFYEGLFIKPFETPQKSVKIKILIKFLSWSGIEMGRVNRSFLHVHSSKIYIASFNWKIVMFTIISYISTGPNNLQNLLQGPTFFSAYLLARRKALGNRLLHVCFSSFYIFADIWKGFHPLVTSTSSIYMFYMSPLSYHALKFPNTEFLLVRIFLY